jgi:hypothetical protein
MFNWLNPEVTEETLRNKAHLLPNNFNWEHYIENNPDLASVGINNKKDAIAHYLMYGQYEKRIVSKNQLNQMGSPVCEIDKDFDENFYLEEYPDVKVYFQHLVNVPIRDRLFDHYNKFGKIESRFKNKTEKLQQEIDKTNLSSKISLKDFTFTSNKLECVCLLLSHNEVSNGAYSDFIQRFCNSIKRQETQNIQFVILTNRTIPEMELEIKKLESIFVKNIQIINASLSIEEDIYVKQSKDSLIKTLPYGTKSGPNLLFFKAIEACKGYNTTLLLETDCFFQRGWLTKIKNFVSHSNGFWISGAIYDGKIACKASSCMMTHINGGTALYATGNHNFQIFLRYAEQFILKKIKNGLIGLAYDYGIKMFIDGNINEQTHTKEDILVWKLVNRQYLPNKLIGNFSIESDRDLKIEDINKIYNYYIIHKK